MALRRVCVFCGSAAGRKPAYRRAAARLGEALARRRLGLVYGGARNVGKANKDLENIHHVCCDAITKGVEQLKPGKRVKDVVLAMEGTVKDSGYLFKPPTGHICAIDLVEARVTPQNEMVLEPRTAVIIHPTVFTPDGKRSFFWGETYLVKQEGYERLNRRTDKLLTL